MKKLSKFLLFWGLSIFMVLLIIFSESFRDSLITYLSSIWGFQFEFSFSHLLSVITFISILILLYKTLNKNVNEKYYVQRVTNTLLYDDSFSRKSLIVSSAIIYVLLVIHLIGNLINTPELLIVLIVFYAILLIPKLLELIFENKTNLDSDDLEDTLIFNECSVLKYEELDIDQQRIANYLNRVIESSDEDYLSIAVNGKWGAGKSSITNGFKDKFNQYEYIEINLWNMASPFDSIKELKKEILNSIKKAYIIISNEEIGYFNSFISEFNTKVASLVNIFSKKFTIIDSKSALEKRIRRTLEILNKKKLVVVFDDIDRIPSDYVNFYLKQIAYIAELKNVVSITNISIEDIERKLTIPLLQVKNIDEERTINFLDKIFSVRINTPNNQNAIRFYTNKTFVNWSKRLEKLNFKDKDVVISDVRSVLDHSPNIFDNYREVKQVFNDLVTFYFAFNNQNLEINKYLPTKIVFVLTIIKFQYPYFYEQLINYIKNHLDNFESPSLNLFEKVDRKEYNIQEFISQSILSGEEQKEDGGRFESMSVKVKFLKTEYQYKKLYYLIEIAIKHGLVNILIAEKYVRNKIQEYEITYEEIEPLVQKAMAVGDIVKLLYSNNTLKTEFHPNLISVRVSSFINTIKKISVYPGNRLKAMIAVLDVYFFNEKSLKEYPTLREYTIFGICSMFNFSAENEKELHEIDFNNFDYPALFDIWAQIINVEGGFDLLFYSSSVNDGANKLDILFSPRIKNIFVKSGHVFFTRHQELDEITLLEKEKFVIDQIWNHKFAQRSFLNHLLLLQFYRNHKLYDYLNSHFDKKDPNQIYLKFEHSLYLKEILNIISDRVFGDLNEPGFYLMLSKYKSLSRDNLFELLFQLIRLNILASNDEWIFDKKLLHFEDLFKQSLESLSAKDLASILENVKQTVIFRIDNKSLPLGYLEKVKDAFPEIPLLIKDRNPTLNKIEQKLIKLQKKTGSK